MSDSGDHYPNPNADICGNRTVYRRDDPHATPLDTPTQPQVASERGPERAAGFFRQAQQLAATIFENAGRDYITRLHDPTRLP